jgi:hypothetical protein
MATVDLRVELTNHYGEENHGQPRNQEHVGQPFGESPKFSATAGFSGNVDGEDNQDNHELTSQKVAIEVVAFVDDGSTPVRVFVGVLVEITIDWPQTDYGSLASFHHRQPSHGDNEDDKGRSGVHIAGEPGVLGEDETHNEGNAKDEEEARVDVLNPHTGFAAACVRGHGA